MDAPKTYFIDLDGTLFHYPDSIDGLWRNFTTPLPGTVEWLKSRLAKGAKIVLTTSRPEFLRAVTEVVLKANEIHYHALIMDCTDGQRILINDKKPGQDATALGFSVDRNAGLSSVSL